MHARGVCRADVLVVGQGGAHEHAGLALDDHLGDLIIGDLLIEIGRAHV